MATFDSAQGDRNAEATSRGLAGAVNSIGRRPERKPAGFVRMPRRAGWPGELPRHGSVPIRLACRPGAAP